MKKILSIEHIQRLHREGKLAEAKQGYMAILQEDANNVSALHLLGIVYAEEGKLEAAQDCLEKAIFIKPNDPSLYLHLANILKARGLVSQAIAILLELVNRYPTFAAAFNNLGTLYFAQEAWQEAVYAYQKAIAIQANYTDAYYNLGLAFTKLGNISQAIVVYESVLDLNIEHAGARFQLATLLMQQGEYQVALKNLLTIELLHPYHFETQSNIASCYLKLGKLHEAEKSYLKALAIKSDDKQVLFNLGVLHMQKGEVDKAIEFYSQAITYHANFFAAHNNIGVAYLVKKNFSQALLHFQEAARLDPHNEAIRHTLNILKQTNGLSTSPVAYIRSLFDSYADHYDAHLVENLHYQVPVLLYEAVKKASGAEQEKKWDMLDLGCGTGLCGHLFRPLARSLIGIDLSENMLQQARQKNIYDELIQADILSFLSGQQQTFDLIIAGDVLVYFGDLASLFFSMGAALKKKGLCAFNVEYGKVKDYRMTATGRFIHGAHYIERLAQQAGFSIVSCQKKIFRTQEGAPISGYIYLLQHA